MKGNSTTALLVAAFVLIVASGAAFAYQNSSSPASPSPVVTQNPPAADTDATSTVSASTTPPVTDPGTPSNGTSFAIKVGQTVHVGSISLTLNSITEDSRCPANVNCIWAGRVGASFSALSGTDSETVNIKTDSAIAFGGYDFKIEEVSPQKTSSIAAQKDYVLTISYISNN